MLNINLSSFFLLKNIPELKCKRNMSGIMNQECGVVPYFLFTPGGEL